MSGEERKTGPAAGWYALAVLPLICGFAVMVVVLFTQLSQMGDQLEQIVVPGARELSLEPGAYTVFLEHRSVVDGRTYVVNDISGLAVRVEAADGTPVAIRTPMGNSTYAFGSRQGSSIHVFQIEQAGNYRISGDYEGGTGARAVIAVGRDFSQGLLVTVFTAIGSALLGVFLAIATGVAVFLLRRRAGLRA